MHTATAALPSVDDNATSVLNGDKNDENATSNDENVTSIIASNATSNDENVTSIIASNAPSIDEEDNNPDENVDYFYAVTYMGGQWDKLVKNVKIPYVVYDTLTYRLLHYDTQFGVPECIRDIKKKYYYMMRTLNTIGINEHYFAAQIWFHLVYDVDEVHNEDEYLDAIKYFDGLSVILGPYSIAEYTTNAELSAKYNIPMPKYDNKMYTKIDKYYSAHIVFYQRKIHINTLKELFATYKNKQLNKICFLNDGIKYQDITIWKDLCNGKGRIMRTAISDKICGKYDKANNVMNWEQFKPTHTIVTDKDKKPLPLSTNLISINPQILNTLQEITHDDLVKCGIVFHKLEDKMMNNDGTIRQKYQRNTNANKTINIKKLNDLVLRTESYDHMLITMTYDELADMLKLIYDSDNEVKYELGKTICSILCHQAVHVFTNKDKLADVLTVWYNNNTKHGTPECMSNYINTYYGQDTEVSNKWFYSLMKHINPNEQDKKNELKTKYSICIRDDININNYNPITEFTINHVQRRRYAISIENDEEEHEYVYKLNGLYELINDLKYCVGFCYGNFYIVTNDDQRHYFICDKQKLINTFITHPFGNDITLASIIIKYVDYFQYDKVVFCTEKKLNTMPITDTYNNTIRYLNLFRGWYANDVENITYENMFKRVLRAICNNNGNEFNEVVYRLSYIINNVTHTDVVEYFQGLCGTGKGTITKILGSFAEQYIIHVNSIDDVLRENSLLEGAILVFMNELPKYNENKGNDQSHFKEYITDDYIKIRDLYIKKHNSPNSSNYFVFTNNINAISLTHDDRRFNIHDTSSIITEAFFTEVNNAFEEHHDAFRDAVYHYLLHWIEDNTELLEIVDFKLRKPMDTEARRDLIAATTNQYEYWIQTNKPVYNAFATDGICNFTTAIENLLIKYPPEGKTLNSRLIKSWQCNLKPYFDKVRKSKKVKGKTIKVYMLLDKFIDAFKPADDEDNDKNDNIDLGEKDNEEEEVEEEDKKDNDNEDKKDNDNEDKKDNDNEDKKDNDNEE